MRRKTATIIAAATIGAAGIGGIALAPALADNTATPSASSTSAPPSDAQRTADRTTAIKEALAGLVKDGTLTQAQADKVAATLATAMPAGRGGPDGPGGRMMEGGREAMAAAAKALNLTEDALRTKLAAQTLGQIADAAKVSRSTVVDAMVKAATAHVTAEVKAGRMTKATGDEIVAGLKARFTQLLDQQMPAGRGGPGGRGGHHGHDGDGMGGPGGPGSATGNSTSKPTDANGTPAPSPTTT